MKLGSPKGIYVLPEPRYRVECLAQGYPDRSHKFYNAEVAFFKVTETDPNMKFAGAYAYYLYEAERELFTKQEADILATWLKESYPKFRLIRANSTNNWDF